MTERKQYVIIGNAESSLKTATCGVPQGSTLGPLLFCCINPLTPEPPVTARTRLHCFKKLQLS